jgi:beta-lactamase regulating signal transducer with metallopeptidase domain
MSAPAAPAAGWLFAVWLTGAVALLTVHAVAQVRFERVVVSRARAPAPSERALIEAAAAGAPACDFRVSSAVESPVACGLFKPVVLLPETFLTHFTAEEQRVMALHEAEHIRAGHIAHRLAARVIRDVFWFHPLAWLAERAFVSDQELACDQVAIGRDRSIRPRTYAETLLKAVDLVSGRTSAPAATVPLIAMTDLRRRTDMLSRHAAVGPTRRAGALLLGGVATVSVLAGLAMMSRLGADAPAPSRAAGPSAALETAPAEPAEPAGPAIILVPRSGGFVVPVQDRDAAEAPDVPVVVAEPGTRAFSADVGALVVAAQQKLSATPPDFQGAREDLDRALAMGPNAYELGVILYMRGGARYQQGDTTGALADWERALAEGDLAPAERSSVQFNIGQLKLSEGDYRGAIEGIGRWIELGGTPNDGVHLNLAAAYVEIGDLEKALEHARRAFEIAEPRQQKHYDTLAYLYEQLGRTDELGTLLDSYPPEFRGESYERQRRALGDAP